MNWSIEQDQWPQNLRQSVSIHACGLPSGLDEFQDSWPLIWIFPELHMLVGARVDVASGFVPSVSEIK